MVIEYSPISVYPVRLRALIPRRIHELILSTAFIQLLQIVAKATGTLYVLKLSQKHYWSEESLRSQGGIGLFHTCYEVDINLSIRRRTIRYILNRYSKQVYWLVSTPNPLPPCAGSINCLTLNLLQIACKHYRTLACIVVTMHVIMICGCMTKDVSIYNLRTPTRKM